MKKKPPIATLEKMPWGKFKGVEIHKIPSSYLKWAAETIDESNSLGKQVVMACDQEWQWREQHNKHINDDEY